MTGRVLQVASHLRRLKPSFRSFVAPSRTEHSGRGPLRALVSAARLEPTPCDDAELKPVEAADSLRARKPFMSLVVNGLATSVTVFAAV